MTYIQSHFVQSLEAAGGTPVTKLTMAEMSVNEDYTYLPSYENLFPNSPSE